MPGGGHEMKTAKGKIIRIDRYDANQGGKLISDGKSMPEFQVASHWHSQVGLNATVMISPK